MAKRSRRGLGRAERSAGEALVTIEDFQRDMQERRTSTPGDEERKQRILDNGLGCLRRLHGDQTWEDWMGAGAALMIVTEEASAEVGASRWDKDNKRLVREFNRRWEEYEARLRSNYKPLTKQERWALREVMTNAEIGSWRVRLDGPEKRKLNHPNAVVNRWKASTRTHELRHMRQPSPALTPAEKDRQGLVRKEALKEPEIDPATFSMTVQQKIEVWKRQEMGRMAAQFSQMVNARVRELLEETILPRHRKEQDEAKRVMNVRKGIMDKATFNAIRRGLHPDSRHSISDKMLGAAFDAFMRLEKLLLDEKQSPTDYQKLPETMAEWDLRREAANAAQKAKRAAGRSAVRPR